MQYHGHSFACLNSAAAQKDIRAVWRVSLVGYEGERTMGIITDSPFIKVYRLQVWDLPALRVISILHAVMKGLALFLTVFFQLAKLPPYQLIVIQNPPCLPALIAAIIISWFNGSNIMIDWHNLGFSMFAERLGQTHALVRVARAMEYFLASFATHHICVSSAMKDWLWANFRVKAVVLYDRPPGVFRKAPISLAERHALLMKLGFTEAALFPSSSNGGDAVSTMEMTIQTRAKSSSSGNITPMVSMRGIRAEESCSSSSVNGSKNNAASNNNKIVESSGGRAALLMSCTSWTPDEDFALLLRALLQLEEFLQQQRSSSGTRKNSSSSNSDSAQPVGYSRVAVVITGKGPMKQEFEAEVAQLTRQGKLNQRVAVRTAWLAPEDYPALLRCADLGVCLHTSTSGLDLPMKVLDMFGSGVPVCAFQFPTLHELVQDGVNGLAFSTSDELAAQIVRLLIDPTSCSSSFGGGGVVVESYVTDDSSGSGIGSGRGGSRSARSSASGGATQQKAGRSVSNQSALQELAQLQARASEITCWEDNWNSTMTPVLLDVFCNE